MPRQKTQLGLRQIKDAILEHLQESPNGLTNSRIADDLGIESFTTISKKGKRNGANFLSHAILYQMVRDGELARERQRYVIPRQ